jgi:hypothetical protein
VVIKYELQFNVRSGQKKEKRKIGESGAQNVLTTIRTLLLDAPAMCKRAQVSKISRPRPHLAKHTIEPRTI